MLTKNLLYLNKILVDKVTKKMQTYIKMKMTIT